MATLADAITKILKKEKTLTTDEEIRLYYRRDDMHECIFVGHTTEKDFYIDTIKIPGIDTRRHLLGDWYTDDILVGYNYAKSHPVEGWTLRYVGSSRSPSIWSIQQIVELINVSSGGGFTDG